jgi:hypothetical protein
MESAYDPIVIEVAPGELIDKITILEIKGEIARTPVQLSLIQYEYAGLMRALETAMDTAEDESFTRLYRLMAELKQVNTSLWKVEDDIRVCEREHDFGQRFIDLARSIYRLNDQRSRLKGEINTLFGSPISEVKSYEPY